MIIIGELINGTRDEVREAIVRRDRSVIEDIARRQSEAGADYIDCNVGMAGEDEPARMSWLVEVVQSAVETPVAIDTTNPDAMQAGLSAWQGDASPLCNSVSFERDRLAALIPLLRDRDVRVVALAMSDDGVPSSVEARVSCAMQLIEALGGAGVAEEDIFIDPVLTPLSVAHNGPGLVCQAICEINALHPDCHTVVGLSNVSYGLPHRSLLNRVFLAQAIASGLDSAILNPLDGDLMSTLFAAEALAGRDEWCERYLGAHRRGAL